MDEEANEITAVFIGDDRRSEPRSTSVYRPVIIETDGYTGFCLIRNLSNGGLEGLVYVDLSEGQPITVQFPTGMEVGGHVAWSKDQRIGVEFNAPIEVAQLLEDLGRSVIGDKVNRAPRISVGCLGELSSEDRKSSVLVHDISQRGVKVTAPFLTLGEQVTLRLDGMDSRKAEVRWSQGGVAGLNFLVPIGFEDLARWVIKRRSTP